MDGVFLLWDVRIGQPGAEPWVKSEYTVHSLTLSPDGKRLFSGGGGGSRDADPNRVLWLWDATTGQPLGEPWRGHDSPVYSVAFSPDGKRMVSSDVSGGLWLWDTDPESWAKKACSIVNRNFSLAEWQRFIGDALSYQKTCPDLPAPGEEGWVEPYTGGGSDSTNG